MATLVFQDHYLELSNEVLYDFLFQGASKLPEVKDLDLGNLLNKRELLTLTSGSFDAPCDKTS